MVDLDLRACLDTAIEAAGKGGEVLRKYWGKLRDVQTKSYKGDLVTEADKESEEVILSFLRSRYPDHAVIGEETGASHEGAQPYLWAVDPLDGTTNYTHQYPMVCVSIGLLVHGEPVLGVVYNPIHDELFEGARGLGVRVNGRDARVSAVDSLDQGLLVTGFAYDRRVTADNNYAEFCHLVTCAQGVRRAGAAALDLAYCAAGRVDGYWERGLKIWDVAAGVALVLEAGGRASAYDGAAIDLYSGQVLVSNGRIHDALSRELIEVRSAKQLG
ncbi:MAG: inositol monophosphatase [Chlamydiia bacterium]|nr:inositol monophosphatase [Chlamydiia bacterium]